MPASADQPADPATPAKPRSIVFDLFGDHLRYHGGRARTQALVELLDVFGVGEPTARIVLARMRKDGWLDTSREGRQVIYRLTDKAWELLDEGRSRIFDRAEQSWDGQWRMVIHHVSEQDRTERERLRKTLSWLGFGPLSASTWISPHDRLADVERALAGNAGVRLDLLTCLSRSRGTDLDMVGRCWDLDALDRRYRELIGRLELLPPSAKLAELAGPEALRLQIDLIADYRRFPFRDPGLPEELLPTNWPGARADRLFTTAHGALAAPAEAFIAGVLRRNSSGEVLGPS